MRQVALVSGSEDARGVAGIAALAFTFLRAFAGQVIELAEHFDIGQVDLPRRAAFGRFLPFGQGRKQPFFRLLGPCDMRFQNLRPRPAQPLQRLQRAPRALPLEPFGVLACGDQRPGGALQEGGNLLVALRLVQLKRFGQPARGGYAEARGMDEGEGFEQVETRQIRVAQPIGHQWRVEQQHGRVRGCHDRIAFGYCAGLAIRRPQPVAAMAGVQCRQGNGRGGTHGPRNAGGRARCKRGGALAPQLPRQSES